jgi:hypothetical protein
VHGQTYNSEEDLRVTLMTLMTLVTLVTLMRGNHQKRL